MSVRTQKRRDRSKPEIAEKSFSSGDSSETRIYKRESCFCMVFFERVRPSAKILDYRKPIVRKLLKSPCFRSLAMDKRCLAQRINRIASGSIIRKEESRRSARTFCPRNTRKAAKKRKRTSREIREKTRKKEKELPANSTNSANRISFVLFAGSSFSFFRGLSRISRAISSRPPIIWSVGQILSYLKRDALCFADHRKADIRRPE